MSKADDLLGLLIDTALQPVDDEPGFDDRGYTSLLDLETNDASEENEDDPAFRGLLDSGLSQQEAQEAVDFMKPLDEEETEILKATPGLHGLTKVDDPEHQQWLLARAKEGNKGMDRVLEDAIYGENDMNHNEERMEREDVDSAQGFSDGWGWKSPFRVLKKGIKKAGSLAVSPLKLAMRFIPGRDARKAALVRNTYKKLWYEHANWLAHQDKAAGLALKPRVQYEYVSKLWAKDQLRRNKLPTSFITGAPSTSGSSDRTAALQMEILGDDGIGSWYWPFGQFMNFARTTINNTTEKRADAPPDEQQSETASPDYQDVSAVQAPQEGASYAPPPDSGPPPGYDEGERSSGGWDGCGRPEVPEGDDSQQGDNMIGWNNFIKIRGLSDVLGGEDSLGAYATQILGQERTIKPAKDNPHVDQIVKILVLKLKAGKPISPGEIGLLSSAAKEGNTSAQRVIAVLKTQGAVVSGDSTGMDPWLYKLSPGYWLRSKTSKEMKDIEEKKWVQNAALMKQLSKQKEDLSAAEKAAQAAQAVETAKAQAAATEAQLKEITASLKGGMSGSFVGHEQITPISQVVVNALDKTGNKEAAGKLYAKIRAGQALDPDELKAARKIANIIGRMRVVHGKLIGDQNEAVTMHGAFIGACMLGSVAKAIEQNARYQHLLAGLGNKIAANKPLAQPERNALAATLKGQKAMHGLVTSMVSGRAFIGSPQKKSWTKGAFVGAAKVMSDEDKKMLSAIVKLAKVGNPRAQKALVALKQSGEIAGGDFIGFSLTKAFKYATAPVWLPAYGAYKGAKWVGKKTGIISKGGSSPEQQRLAMMAAAAKRRQAAAARAAAADAQSEAEQRAQLAIADAADAEADAADAEALAKEQAMKTREVQADPGSLATDSEGDFIGKESKEAKLLAKYNEQSPTGIKLRAGTKLYTQGKAKTPEGRQARQAIKIMIQKANAGDPQAKRDAYAVKAGQKVYRAQKKVQKRKAILAIRDARKKRVIAVQKQFEARTANKLCRISRKRELKKHWKVERMAAAGHPKAKAYVAKQVALSKRGDKKAQAHVAAMKQGRLIRQKIKTPREARNMKQAERFARRLQRNDPSTLRQYEVLKAAANKGNPNAIRAIDRIMLAAMVVKTVNTGVVCMEPRKKKSRRAQIAQKGSTAHKRAQRQVALAKQKAATGTAKREELAAGAEAAHELGDNKTAALLANAASKAPSAANEINVKVQVINAAEKGHPEAKAELAKNLEDAKKGDVAGVKEMGKIMAADTVDKVNKGEPVSPTMTDAINLHERVKAKDPAAIAQAKEITEQATSPNPPPEATLAASGLVAAAIVSQSLAHKPKARTEFMEKINPPIPPEEKTVAHAEVAAAVTKANEGTITAEEGRKASDLALRLGKPRVAAEIMAKSPPWDETPLSSLPDQPLSPITNLYELFVATLQAFTFSTKDPLANYRGGIANRGKTPSMSPPVASMGWSPFKIFQTAKKVAPFTPFAAPIAAATAIHTAVTKKDAPAPATEAAAPAPATTAGRAEICGSDDFKDLIAKALKTKKMSKDDFNKAVKSNLPSNADEDTKKASTQQTLKFLQSKNVTVGGAFVGMNKGTKSFKEHVVEAVKAKKMSKDDFNKAIDVHVGPQASKETKKAAGEKTLKFLLDKGVKVG